MKRKSLYIWKTETVKDWKTIKMVSNRTFKTQRIIFTSFPLSPHHSTLLSSFPFISQIHNTLCNFLMLAIIKCLVFHSFSNYNSVVLFPAWFLYFISILSCLSFLNVLWAFFWSILNARFSQEFHIYFAWLRYGKLVFGDEISRWELGGVFASINLIWVVVFRELEI